jgi:uncharacterized protein DUF1573
MKQVFSITILILSGIITVYAQNNNDKIKGRFYFPEGEQHDLGIISPSRAATDTFWFENIGISPIQMTFVSTSSALVTADWTREVVKGEQKGFVACMVRPGKKPGPFTAELFVQSNALEPSGIKAHVLHIKGETGKDNSRTAKKKKTVKKPVTK